MTQPQVLTISVVELDCVKKLRCNLLRNIETKKAATQMNQKKLGTRKSDRISNQH